MVTPASRDAPEVAAPAVSQADNMTTSASSLRSNISLKLNKPSEPSAAKLVTSAEAARKLHDLTIRFHDAAVRARIDDQ